MNIKPTPLTLKSAKLFRALLPSQIDKLNQVILHLSDDLLITPPECLSLIKRCENPGLPPIFDGTHDEADWYNNNIQIPRLLVSLANHLGIENSLPSIYSIEPRLIDSLEQARFFIDAYVKQKRKSIGL